MNRYGAVPYVYKSRGAAILNIVIAVVLAIFTIVFAAVAFPASGPDALYIVCAAVFGLVSALAFFLGIGSLAGQRVEKAHNQQ